MDLKFSLSFTALRVIRTSLFCPQISIALTPSHVAHQTLSSAREIGGESPSRVQSQIPSPRSCSCMFRLEYDNDKGKGIDPFRTPKFIALQSSDLGFIAEQLLIPSTTKRCQSTLGSKGFVIGLFVSKLWRICRLWVCRLFCHPRAWLVYCGWSRLVLALAVQLVRL